jgi:Spy/CpxP family protein refolding chaperone
MRKTILTGIALAVAMAGTVAAQQPDQAPGRRAKADSGKHERFDRRGGPPGGFLLRGITLTDAQKNQFKELRTAEQAKMQANRAEMKKQVDAVREARQRGDTAAARALAERQRLARTQAREQHVAALRNILTAEQRVQFDKNVAEVKQREAQRGERFGRGGPKGPRGQRGPGGDRFGR